MGYPHNVGVPRVKDPLFAPRSWVVFLDLLGFADMLKQRTDFYNSDEMVKKIYTSPARSPRTFAARDVRTRYLSFKKNVDLIIRSAQRRRRSTVPLTSIVFSDSLFTFFESADEAVQFARLSMQRMINARLPVRMGLAWGTADRLSFTSETLPSNDVVLSAPFLGTGVVHAYRAESCGVKGLRILVSEVGRIKLEKTHASRLLKLPDGEANDLVKYELNYLSAGRDKERTEHFISKVGAFKEDAPAEHKQPYVVTLKALKRMHRANSLHDTQRKSSRRAPGSIVRPVKAVEKAFGKKA